MKTCERCGKDFDGFDTTCDPCTFRIPHFEGLPPPSDSVVYLPHGTGSDCLLRQAVLVDPDLYEELVGLGPDDDPRNNYREVGYRFATRLMEEIPWPVADGIAMGILRYCEDRARKYRTNMSATVYSQAVRVYMDDEGIPSVGPWKGSRTP